MVTCPSSDDPFLKLVAGIDGAHIAEPLYDTRQCLYDIVYILLGVLMAERNAEGAVGILNGHAAGYQHVSIFMA